MSLRSRSTATVERVKCCDCAAQHTDSLAPAQDSQMFRNFALQVSRRKTQSRLADVGLENAASHGRLPRFRRAQWPGRFAGVNFRDAPKPAFRLIFHIGLSL